MGDSGTGRTAPIGTPYPLVLVVDDDPDARALARLYAEDCGFRVAEARDGHQALGRFDELAPAIVLMDARMPGLDGFAAASALRRRPHGAQTPILLTTARTDDAALAHAFESGVSEVLPKPLRKTIVQNRLRLLYENRVAHAALRDSEQRNRQLVDLSPEAMAIFLEARFVYLNRAAVECLAGVSERQFADRTLYDFLDAGQEEWVRRYLEAVGRGGRASERIEARLQTLDGGLREVEITASPYPYYGHTAVLAHIHDVTERKAAEREARLAAQVVESTTEGVMVADADNRIVSVNPAFTRVTGYTAEEAIGRTPALLKSGRHDAAFYRGIWQALEERGEWQGEIWNRRKNGEIYPEWLNISVVYDDETGRPSHHVAIFSDITAIKKAEARLQRLAHYDALTGLANRNLFLERLEQALIQADRTGECFAVLFLDLDHFKEVNDRLGHHAGDCLLEEVGRRLEGCLRKSDTPARLGGDEFTVLLRHVRSRRDVVELARVLVEVLEHPFELSGRHVEVTTSIGIALHPGSGTDVATLTRRADEAMYRAKLAGRNTYRFDGEGGPASGAPAIGEDELIRALEHDEFALAYQPYYRNGGVIAGFEALLRWRHPEHGELAPAHFLPLVEECGLILAVGDWVLRRACRQARQWNAKRPEAPLGLAVNLSRRQLVDLRFAERVGRILAKTGLAPELLELDAAESILLGDLGPLMHNLSQLRALGVRIAVDDFGGGLGGLDRLRDLPVDAVKIDRSCVSRLTEAGPERAAAGSVIAQAHRLHMEVFAEGVETPEQLRFLQEHACDHTQGFYHQHPVAAEEVDGLLLRDPR